MAVRRGRTLLALGVALSSHVAAARPLPSVAVGGVAGLEALADPDASRGLRADGHVGLYIHDYAWTRLPLARRRQILALFPGPQDVELGLVPDPARWFRTVWEPQYAALGVRGRTAHVNGLGATRGRTWRLFVDEARRHGFTSVAPVMAPNSRQYVAHPFGSPHWDYLRQAALYGGGLTTDAPSDHFLTEPPGYRAFVAAELAWARSQHLVAAFIVSPGRSGRSFWPDTERVLAGLRTADIEPDLFIVENYEPAAESDYPNPVGRDDEPGTIAATALSIARQLRPR